MYIVINIYEYKCCNYQYREKQSHRNDERMTGQCKVYLTLSDSKNNECLRVYLTAALWAPPLQSTNTPSTPATPSSSTTLPSFSSTPLLSFSFTTLPYSLQPISYTKTNADTDAQVMIWFLFLYFL